MSKQIPQETAAFLILRRVAAITESSLSKSFARSYAYLGMSLRLIIIRRSLGLSINRVVSKLHYLKTLDI